MFTQPGLVPKSCAGLFPKAEALKPNWAGSLALPRLPLWLPFVPLAASCVHEFDPYTYDPLGMRQSLMEKKLEYSDKTHDPQTGRCSQIKGGCVPPLGSC